MKTLTFQARGLALALATGLATLMSAAPASAQWFYEPRPPRAYPAPVQPYEPSYERYEPDDRFEERRVPVERAISPRWIMRSLTAQGYEPVSRLRRSGDVYRIVVEDERGDRLTLTIDAYDGEIIRRSRMAAVPRRERDERFFDDRPGPAPRSPAPRAPSIEEDEDDEIVVRREAPPPRVSRVEPSAPLPAPAVRPPREERRAVRTEPPALKGPEITPTPPRRPAQTEPAARPSATPPAEAKRPEPAPATSPAAPAPATTPPTAAEAEQAKRSVRVIDGVTPVIPRAESADPGAPSLPAPDVPAPVTID
jgi:hypothetical protein